MKPLLCLVGCLILVSSAFASASEVDELIAGNKRFVAGQSRHADQNAAARKRLVDGQKPQAIVLACSDSRVPPELVFDQGLGQLFTVRVAGNTATSAEVASIEY